MFNCVKVGSLSAAALTFLVSACAQIPTEELTQYAQTYDQARQAGHLVLSEVASVDALRAAGADPNAKDCPIVADHGFRDCFSLELALGPSILRRDEIVDLRVRRLALEQIGAYNSLLTDLALGKSADALNKKIDDIQALTLQSAGFVGAASAPGLVKLDAFVNLAQPLLDKLERMRAQAVARDSILVAEDDLVALLDLLKEDAPKLYLFIRNEHAAAIGFVQADIKIAQLNNDDAEEDALKRELARLSDPSSGRNRARAFEDSLISYVKLLESSKKSLIALVKYIRRKEENPVELIANFAQQAGETKSLAEDLITKANQL